MKKEKISSVDDLSKRIKAGYPAYKPSKFDLILFSYMLKINIILLRSSISEVIGGEYNNNDYYTVLYYDMYDNNTCIPFYLLNKKSKPFISKMNSTLKRLIKKK